MSTSRGCAASTASAWPPRPRVASTWTASRCAAGRDSAGSSRSRTRSSSTGTCPPGVGRPRSDAAAPGAIGGPICMVNTPCGACRPLIDDVRGVVRSLTQSTALKCVSTSARRAVAPVQLPRCWSRGDGPTGPLPPRGASVDPSPRAVRGPRAMVCCLEFLVWPRARGGGRRPIDGRSMGRGCVAVDGP